MKKTLYWKLLGFVCISLASCEKRSPEPEITCNELYYYDANQKVKLNLNLDGVHVIFKNAIGYEVIANFNFLQPVKIEDEIPCGSCSVPRLNNATECKQVFKAIAVLEKSAEVTYASPCVMTPDGRIRFIYNYFRAKLKATTSMEEVNNLVQAYGIVNKYSFVGDTLIFSFYVDKTSKANALEIANLFYETGKFEYCTPELIDWKK